MKQFDFNGEFQELLLCGVLNDSKFGSLVLGSDILQPIYFDNLSGFFRILKDAFSKYSAIPSSDVLKRIIDQSSIGLAEKSKAKEIISNHHKKISDKNRQYIQEEVVSFIQYQKMKEAMHTAVVHLQKEEYNNLVDEISKAQQSVIYVEDSHREMNYFTEYESRLLSRADEPMEGLPTNIPELDRRLAGRGVCPGELAVVLGSSGRGKSHFLVKIGRAALFHRKKVLHITLEMNERRIAERYDQTFLSLTKDDLFTDLGFDKLRKFMTNEAKAFMHNMQESLIIKFWPMRSVTIHDIKRYIERKIRSGFFPDVVIIDYADVIRPDVVYGDNYTELGNIYYDLAGMASEFDTRIWTGSQTNREATKKEVVTISDFAESFKKVHPCHLILALCQTPKEKEKNFMRLFVAKNREGADEFAVKVKTQFETSTIRTLILDGEL